VDARDASEHDVGDVRVTMDGELLARNVDVDEPTASPMVL